MIKVKYTKGGSWGDRLFWLSPGARRYKDEDKSDRTIGFRCAMGRVGGAAGNEDVGGNKFKEGGKAFQEDINNISKIYSFEPRYNISGLFCWW